MEPDSNSDHSDSDSDGSVKVIQMKNGQSEEQSDEEIDLKQNVDKQDLPNLKEIDEKEELD